MAKGRNPERKYTGPPGYWGFSVGLTTPWPPSKSTTVTETQMKHQTYTSCLVGGSSPSPCERITSNGQSQQHRIPTRLILLSPKQRRSRRRERPRTTWRRDTDHIIQSRDLSLHQLERLSRDRGDWRDFVSGLCSEMEKVKASVQIRSDFLVYVFICYLIAAVIEKEASSFWIGCVRFARVYSPVVQMTSSCTVFEVLVAFLLPESTCSLRFFESCLCWTLCLCCDLEVL